MLVRGLVWITALEQGYELAAAVEAATAERLKRAEVAHFDEMGQRVAGRLCWLHTASNSLHTHLFVHPRHGGEALHSAASALKDFGGRAIHDCLPAYYRFEDMGRAWRTSCANCVEQWAGMMQAFLCMNRRKGRLLWRPGIASRVRRRRRLNSRQAGDAPEAQRGAIC